MVNSEQTHIDLDPEQERQLESLVEETGIDREKRLQMVIQAGLKTVKGDATKKEATEAEK